MDKNHPIQALSKLCAWGFGLLFLAACGDDDDAAKLSSVQRFELDEIPLIEEAQADRPLISPDMAYAYWSVAPSGKALQFGDDEAAPWLTLDCRLSDEEPPQMVIIRHASALPGQGVLFSIIGNGVRSIFLSDATFYSAANEEGLEQTGWRWEVQVEANDPKLDVFTGPGDLRATLPGKGSLETPRSRIPREFVTWCRASGRPIVAPQEQPSE